MPRLAHRFTSFPAYPLAHIPARKKALIDAGVDVIDLGAGDADLAPPPAAVLALQQAAEVPAMQRYGFGLGLVRYREAVAAWMHTRFGQHVDPMTEIVPLLGSKEGLAHIAFAFALRAVAKTALRGGVGALAFALKRAAFALALKRAAVPFADALTAHGAVAEARRT